MARLERSPRSRAVRARRTGWEGRGDRTRAAARNPQSRASRPGAGGGTAASVPGVAAYSPPIRLELVTPDIGRPVYRAVTTVDALAP